MNVISAINSSAIYAKVGEQYLFITAGTLTGEPISALRAKQDALTFGYDGNDSITSINTSALAGGGDMYTSNIEYDGSNNITAYNGKTFKDTTIATDLSNLQSVSSTVNSNSSIWDAALSGVSVDGTPLTVTNNIVNVVLTGKVDVETGKGLSTNDYVTTAKNVVDNAALVIPAGANANNQLVSNSAMQAAIANVGHFEITGLNNQNEPDVQNPSTKIFYLTRPSTAAATDPYTEWIYTESDDPTPVTAWNVIGSTQIDLHGYAKLPSTYTEDHIIAFGSSDTVKDTGVTTAQIGGSISGITLNGGVELPINAKVINIPVATNTNNVGTDGIMAGADKVKLDNILTAYASDNYLSLSTANQTVTYGLNVTTGTYSNTDVITQIGGSGLSAYIADSANSAANSNKLNGQQAGYYCSDSNARIYSNFAGGNGITVAGELTQTKSINSNLTEYQLQEGVGITFEVDDVNETVKFNAKPEIFLYYTSTPQMTYSTAIAFDSTNSASYHSKTGTVGISNTEITGLDTTKLYHCNAKLLVDNVGSTPETVSIKATNWHNTDSITYEYVNSSNSGTMELDWYIKGLTGCALTAGGSLSTDVQIGVKEIMITEVCYA